jgi:hypothetical protein
LLRRVLFQLGKDWFWVKFVMESSVNFKWGKFRFSANIEFEQRTHEKWGLGFWGEQISYKQDNQIIRVSEILKQRRVNFDKSKLW